MNSANIAAGLAQTTAFTRRVADFFRRCRSAFHEWRQREKLRSCKLDDRMLADIGMTRGEIDLIDQRDIGSCLRSPSQSAAERLGIVAPF